MIMGVGILIIGIISCLGLIVKKVKKKINRANKTRTFKNQLIL